MIKGLVFDQAFWIKKTDVEITNNGEIKVNYFTLEK